MIEKALATAKPVPARDTDQLQAELARVRGLANNLLPVEAQALAEIRERENDLNTQLALLKTADAIEGARNLDPAVFSWTKSQAGWPRLWGRTTYLDVPVFAYISVREHGCRIGIHESSSLIDAPGVPKAILPHYAAIMNTIRNNHLSWETRSTVRLSYTYQGVIPTHVREIIKRETGMYEEIGQRRFEDVGLVCEVDRWEISSVKAPPRQFLDPLLVGVRANALWVLAAFDPTSVEQYLLDEFAS